MKHKVQHVINTLLDIPDEELQAMPTEKKLQTAAILLKYELPTLQSVQADISANSKTPATDRFMQLAQQDLTIQELPDNKTTKQLIANDNYKPD